MAATGRVPVTKGTVLGLEEAGIELGQRGHINVNEKMCTSVPYIYSAGDCIAGPALASTGVDQAQRAVEPTPHPRAPPRRSAVTRHGVRDAAVPDLPLQTWVWRPPRSVVARRGYDRRS